MYYSWTCHVSRRTRRTTESRCKLTDGVSHSARGCRRPSACDALLTTRSVRFVTSHLGSLTLPKRLNNYFVQAVSRNSRTWGLLEGGEREGRWAGLALGCKDRRWHRWRFQMDGLSSWTQSTDEKIHVEAMVHMIIERGLGVRGLPCCHSQTVDEHRKMLPLVSLWRGSQGCPSQGFDALHTWLRIYS